MQPRPITLHENGSQMALSSELSQVSNVPNQMWANKMDFVLSSIGYAIGLSNIWRFPYLVYVHGGGTFLIPYFLTLFFVAVPLYFLELLVGQYSGLGPIKAYGRMVPVMKGFGFCMVCISLEIAVYYSVLLAWVVYYIFAVFSAELPWNKCSQSNINCIDNDVIITDKENGTEVVKNQCHDGCILAPVDFFFSNMFGQKFTIKYDWCHFGDMRWPLVLCLMMAWTLLGCALIKGVQSSAKIVHISAMFPYVILVIVFAQSMSLDGAMDGIDFYLTVNITKLSEPDVWISASSQILYSIGICYGGLVTMSSYSNFNNDCHSVAVFVSLCNCCVSFVTGLAVFSTLGSMAKATGQKVPDIVTGNKIGLTFMGIPFALSQMPIPHVWAFLFFFTLMTLGLDAMFVLLETAITALMDHFRWFRPYKPVVVLLSCLIGFGTGLSMCTPNGLELLNLMDSHIIKINLLICSLLEVIIIAWCYGVLNFWKHIEHMNIPVPKYMKWYWITCWAFFTPTILFSLIAWKFYEGKGLPDAPRGMSTMGYFLNVAVLIWIPTFAGKAILNRIKKGKQPFAQRLFEPKTKWLPACDIHALS